MRVMSVLDAAEELNLIKESKVSSYEQDKTDIGIERSDAEDEA